MQDLGEGSRVGRGVEHQRKPAEVGVTPLQPVLLPVDVHALRLEVFELATGRQRELGVQRDQGVDAAAGPGADDAHQPSGGRLVEAGRKIGHDQHPKRLGHLAGIGVVLLDRLEFVAQVFLDHIFHVSLKVRQALVEMRRLGPDPAGDEQLVVIGQVHERRKVLAQPDRVEDGESDLAGRDGGEEPKHERLEQLHRLALARLGRLDQDRSPDRKGDKGR